MKNAKKAILKAGVVVAIALLFIMPATAILATKQANEMSIDDLTVHPGDTNVEILIEGEWIQTISGYSIGMQFDPSIVTIVDASNIGTIAEDAFIWNWNVPSPGVFSLGAAWMMPADYKPAGTGILCKLIVDIASDAPIGDTILDLGQFGGSPPVDSLYSDASSQAIVPTCVDGTITVEEEQQYVCGNIDNIIGPGGPIDVSDLTYLVAYLFTGGPEPVPEVCVANVAVSYTHLTLPTN